MSYRYRAGRLLAMMTGTVDRIACSFAPEPPAFPACDRPAVLTTYLTAKRDPQSYRRLPTDRYDRIRPWYESLHRLALNGVVFHDRLSTRFTGTHETPRVRFLNVPGRYLRSTNDHRFSIYRRFLETYSAGSVFMTDLFDVSVVRDPFPMVEAGKIYVGNDSGTLGENLWLRRLATSIGDPRYLDLLDRSAGLPALNAGVLGGETDLVRAFLDRLEQEFRRIDRPLTNANMLLFNYVGHTFFGERLSQAFCSRFKRYESDRTDIPFIHKCAILRHRGSPSPEETRCDSSPAPPWPCSCWPPLPCSPTMSPGAIV